MYQIYADGVLQYRWRLMDGDREAVAIAPKPYRSKQECHEAIAVVKASSRARVIEL